MPSNEVREMQDMPDDAEPKNNAERLLTHLKNDSLAERLVRAHRNLDPDHPADSMNTVLQERLEQVRASIDSNKD